MDEQSTIAAPAGLFRRLAALFYDGLLVVALVAIAIAVVLPLSGGEAITLTSHGAVAYLFRCWLLLVAFSYFGFCWVRGGQTLGLRAWRMRLQSADGRAVSWLAAALRFAGGIAAFLLAVAGVWQLARPGWTPSDAAALLMLLPAIANLAWIPFDSAGRSLQDLTGRMRVVRVPR